MGYWKNKQIEFHGRGYFSISTVICAGCVGDYALKNYIKKAGEKHKCDYCSKIRICCKLEHLIGHIVKSIKFEYEDATGCMGWERKEGGFIGASTYDNYDMIYDVLAEEMGIENEKLLLDIYNTLDHSAIWCEANPYELRIHEIDYINWEEFCKYARESIISLEEKASTSQILYRITGFFIELGLLKTIRNDMGFYRSVIHNKTEVVNSAKRVGSAPARYSKENRMSPEGVSMFYGADNINTTLVEIGAKPTDTITTAKFYPTKRIKVLDLTKLESISFPSLFDDNKRRLRSPLMFLSKFAIDISSKNSGGSVEYLPTQVFTEHIRKFYNAIKLDGIIYYSSQVKAEKCCVLFFDNEHCTNERFSAEKMLWMDKNSLERFN